MLAGVSSDYYTRLEQGRERRPSEQVLDALSRALHLDVHASQHLFRLVQPAPESVPAVAPAVAHPGVVAILNDVIAAPAMVLGPALDVLSMNSQARALYSDFACTSNLLEMVFLDEVARYFYVDWETVARDSVRNVRALSMPFHNDPRMLAVVGRLSIESADFALFWAQHDIRPRLGGTKRFRHSVVGEIDLSFEGFSVNEAPGQQLLIYRADPGSASADALALLNTFE